MLDKFYGQLAMAIIIQAAEDYMYLIKNGKDRMTKERSSSTGSSGVVVTQKELENFFHSRWYGQLTTIDPDYLIRMMNKHAFDKRLKRYTTTNIIERN